jgi:hypothetical protein
MGLTILLEQMAYLDTDVFDFLRRLPLLPAALPPESEDYTDLERRRSAVAQACEALTSSIGAPEAMLAVLAIQDQASAWAHATGNLPPEDQWVAGARELIGALAPSSMWAQCADLLDDALDQMEHRLPVSEDQLLVDLYACPRASVYTWAALTAWLSDQPEVVPDRMRAAADVFDRIERLGTTVAASDPDRSRIHATDALRVPTPRINPRRREDTALRHSAASLLVAFLDGDIDRSEEAMTAIRDHGDSGLRHARAWVTNTMVRWHNRARPRLSVRSSTLIPGVNTLVDQIVPASKRRGVQQVQLGINIRITRTAAGYAEHGGDHGVLYPQPTSDAESDFYLAAAYAAYFGQQSEAQPDQAKAEVVAIASYLGTQDRMLGTTTLTPNQLDQGFTALADRFGKELAASISLNGADRSNAEDELLGVACDYYRNLDDTTSVVLDALYADLQEERADAAEDAATQPQNAQPVPWTPRTREHPNLSDVERARRKRVEKDRAKRKRRKK